MDIRRLLYVRQDNFQPNNQPNNQPTCSQPPPISELERTPLKHGGNGPGLETASVCSETVTLLYQLPLREVVPGVRVPDYSQCGHFDKILHSIPMERAEELRSYAEQYPDKFPMPGMGRTLKTLNQGMDSLLGRRSLTEEERSLLLELRGSLNNLPAKGFPYQESLFLTYQFLHYKSLFHYRDLISHFDVDAIASLNIEQPRDGIRLRDLFLRYHSRYQTSHYLPNCSLKQLKEVSWHLMLKKPETFARELNLLYFSIFLHGEDGSLVTNYGGFKAFESKQLLVPWDSELQIKDLNLGYFLPIWLLGTSMETDTAADGCLMSSAGFFEHDGNHLAVKVGEILPHASHETRQRLCEWIRGLYQKPDKVPAPIFKAVELVLAYIFHERAIRPQLLASFLGEIQSGKRRVDEFKDLPVRFKDVKHKDLRNAAKWLLGSGLVGADGADRHKEFQPVTDWMVFDHMNVWIK